MIKFTRAGEEHIEELGELWMEFMRYSQDIDPIHAPAENSIPVFIDEFLRPAMADDNSLVLVALDGRKAVGYAYAFIVTPHKLNKREKYGVIHDMFVARECRRSGIGQELFNEVIRWFESRNIHRVELDVITRNRVASNFWGKMGFTDLNRTLFKQV